MTVDSSGQGEELPDPDTTTDKYVFELYVPNESNATDYYFDIEKIIFVDKNVHDRDQEQQFVFKVDRFNAGETNFTTPEDTFYVTLNCDKEMTYSESAVTLDHKAYPYSFYHADDAAAGEYPQSVFIATSSGVKIKKTYQNAVTGTTEVYTYPAAIWNGRKTIHVKQDGIYRVTEVSGWSSTDYDFWKGSNVYKGYGTPITQPQSSDSVMFDVATVSANLFEDSTTQINGAYRPTASFTNSETEFAYLSSQAYADNTIKRS